jgi:hypothetical protein
MGRFQGPCELFTYKLPMTPSLFCLFKIGIPFALKFHMHSTSIYGTYMCCDISNFDDISFIFFYRSSMIKNGFTCPLAIWPKLCITTSCNNQENITLVCKQWRLITTFVFSKNLHCIDNICKVVHLVMVMIGMNYCWRGLKGEVILLDLPH